MTILARSDSSSDGLVNQYLGQLLSAVSTAATPDKESSEDVLRRNSIACQALQVAEVLSGDDGAAYATSTTEIILKADNQRTRGVGMASPTLSSRSRTSTDTKASGKGRGGTMEKAIEMILTRARRGIVSPTSSSQCVLIYIFSCLLLHTVLWSNYSNPLESQGRRATLHHLSCHRGCHSLRERRARYRHGSTAAAKIHLPLAIDIP